MHLFLLKVVTALDKPHRHASRCVHGEQFVPELLLAKFLTRSDNSCSRDWGFRGIIPLVGVEPTVLRRRRASLNLENSFSPCRVEHGRSPVNWSWFFGWLALIMHHQEADVIPC